MLCDLLSRVLRFVCRRVLGFLFRSSSSVMGCFLACLRFKDDDGRNKKPDVDVARNRSSSFFADEERGNNSDDSEGNWVYGSPKIGKEIKDEARFLKACGTIPETPVEIRKAGEKLRMSPPPEVYSVTPKFHSWMPYLRNFWADKQPLEILEGFEIDEESPEHTPISCISNADNSKRTCISSTEEVASGYLISRSKVIDEENVSITTPFTPWSVGKSAQGGKRSVYFHHDINIYSPDDSLQRIASRGLKMKEPICTGSAMKVMAPPTPLELSDEMQTPGTVFPANLENVQKGKAGIRSHYVYSVPNPATNASQLKSPNEEISLHKQLSDHQETQLEATLSSWLKPPTDEQPQFGRTYGDKPILGLVTAHWNEEEQLHCTPKLGGGNGIPNSTSKHHEDQKVGWNATPFEERLEKALSEENSPGNGYPLHLTTPTSLSGVAVIHVTLESVRMRKTAILNIESYATARSYCHHTFSLSKTPFWKLELSLPSRNHFSCLFFSRSHFSRLPITLEGDADGATSQLQPETTLLPC